MKANDIHINLNPSSSQEPKVSVVAKTVENVVETVANSSWQRIAKVYLVLLCFLSTILGGFFAYNVVSDKEAVHQAAMKMAKDEKEEGIRDFVITPKIQKNLDAILYTLNADRAYLIEFHNGKKNATGLPFRYMDISYEVINVETKATKVGIQYQNIPTTLHKFPYYLQQHRMYIGTVEDFKKIDTDLAIQMEGNFARYFAMITLNSDGTPLGYLGVTWCNMEDIPDKATIKNKLLTYDRVFSPLLDLRIQTQGE